MIGNTGGIYNYWNCFKVLPTIYDDSLSYYEVLCKLTYTIDQVIKQIDMDNSEMYNYIDNQDIKVLTLSKQYTNAEIVKLENKLNISIANLMQLIDVTNANTRAWIALQLTEMKEWLSRQGGSILVENPITGKLDSLQNVLESYYNMFNYYALTCIEYESLGITCDEYDEKELTCEMYDFYSRKYLWEDNKLLMFHPITGIKTCYKNVIDFLVEQHRNESLTCSEYDTKNISATQYDMLLISAYDYDWHSKTII